MSVVMAGIFSPLTVREQTVLELCASVEENNQPEIRLLFHVTFRMKRVFNILAFLGQALLKTPTDLGIDQTRDRRC